MADFFRHTADIQVILSGHVETVVQLSKGDIDRDISERKSIAKTDDIGMINGTTKGIRLPRQ